MKIGSGSATKIGAKLVSGESCVRLIKIKYVVYQIRNLVNSKVYVGSAVDFRNRISVHKQRLNSNANHNIHLQNAWNKYGELNFVFEILEYCDDALSLIASEQYWINFKNACDKRLAYNIRPTAGYSPLGTKHSNETKAKMSETRKGKLHSIEAKRKMSIAAIGNQKAKNRKSGPRGSYKKKLTLL